LFLIFLCGGGGGLLGGGVLRWGGGGGGLVKRAEQLAGFCSTKSTRSNEKVETLLGNEPISGSHFSILLHLLPLNESKG
jgi:hypothetical protein